MPEHDAEFAVTHAACVHFMRYQAGTCGAAGAWRHAACQRAVRCAAPPLSRFRCMLCTCQCMYQVRVHRWECISSLPTPSRHASFEAQNPNFWLPATASLQHIHLKHAACESNYGVKPVHCLSIEDRASRTACRPQQDSHAPALLKLT